MRGKHPSSIITDQDSAMAAAIRKVFPNTPHRLCLWHIKKKFGERLSHIYHEKSKFKSEMNYCIHSTYQVQDFEDKWNAMIADFKLNDNDWLRNLYEIRKSWVLVYHRGTFYAGMNTTGRSEGVNAFFNEFVTQKTNLREFVVKYDQALKKIIERESYEDYISEHTDRIIDANNLILKQGAQIYTRTIFEKFRKRLANSIRFKATEIEKGTDMVTYLVTAKVGVPEQFTLKINPETYEGYCECKNFEFKGLPCSHVLKILNKLEVDEIPSYFILNRWKKRANSFRMMDELPISDDYECSEAFRLSHLCRRSTQMACVASKSEKLYKMAIEEIEGLFARIMDEHNKMVECEANSQASKFNVQEDIGAEILSQPFIQDPHLTRRKGRPKDDKGKGKVSSTGRIMSSMEASSSRGKRKCTICQQRGHDKRKCPKKTDKEQLKISVPSSGEDEEVGIL